MSKFSPGPWKWGEDWDKASHYFSFEDGADDPDMPDEYKYLDWRLTDANHEDILPLRVDHFCVEMDMGSPIREADRNLIATAPELYEACTEAMNLIGAIGGPAYSEEFRANVARIIVATLAKARGEA